MLDPRKKPTPEDIISARGQLTEVWADGHAVWKKVDVHIQGKDSIWPSADGVNPLGAYRNRPAHQTNTARGILEHAVDTQLGYDPKVSKFPNGEGDEHKTYADQAEKGVKAGMDEASLLETELPFRAAGRHLLSYGYSITEGPVMVMTPIEKPTKRDGEDAEEFEAREADWRYERATWLPWRIRAPHPATVLMSPTEKRPRWAIRQRQMYAGDLMALLQMKHAAGAQVEKADIAERRDYDKLNVTDFWSRYWHAVLVNADMVLLEKNIWGYLQFKHAFGGFGQEETDGDYGNPRYMGTGMLDAALDMITLQAQLVNAASHAAIRRAFAKLLTTEDTADAAEKLAAGEIVHSDVEEGYKWLEHPDAPVNLFQLLQWVDAQIERLTFSSALGGYRAEGVSTASQQAMLSSAAAKRFKSPSVQLEGMATLIANDICRSIEVMSREFEVDSVTVRGHKLTKAMIDDSYATLVRFELVDPYLDLQKRDVGLRELAAGVITQERYGTDYAGIEDYSLEQEKLRQQNIMQLPNVAAAFNEITQYKIGVRKFLVDLEMRMKASGANGGNRGPQGTPTTLYGPRGETLPIAGPQAQSMNPGGVQSAVMPGSSQQVDQMGNEMQRMVNGKAA